MRDPTGGDVTPEDVFARGRKGGVVAGVRLTQPGSPFSSTVPAAAYLPVRTSRHEGSPYD